MSKIIEREPVHFSKVTVDDVVNRFSGLVVIHNAPAFAAELQAFVAERVEALKVSTPSKSATLMESLADKANSLRAKTGWRPNETDIQRGRSAQLESFNDRHNLPLTEFASLANKSRQQIYKDIDAGRLLALNVGPRGQKLPDWQLDPVKQELTQAVLQEVEGIDNWTLYRALSEPLDRFDGLSPVNAVTPVTLDVVRKAVLNLLSVH